MKNLFLTKVVIVLIGCTESVEIKVPDNTYKEQFEIADQRIAKMLETLDRSDVPMDQKREILCTKSSLIKLFKFIVTVSIVEEFFID